MGHAIQSNTNLLKIQAQGIQPIYKRPNVLVKAAPKSLRGLSFPSLYTGLPSPSTKPRERKMEPENIDELMKETLSFKEELRAEINLECAKQEEEEE